GQRNEWREIAKVVGEVCEKRGQLANSLGDHLDALTSPPFPFIYVEDQARLHQIGVLGQKEKRHACHRDVDGLGPIRRRIDNKPNHVEVVVLVFHLKLTQPPNRRKSPVSADHHVSANLKRSFSVANASHADHRAVFFDKFFYVGPHPAVEAGEWARLFEESVQKDHLRHPDRIGIVRGDRVEAESSFRYAVNQELPLSQRQVRLIHDVTEKSDLIEKARRARLKDFAPELAVEGVVLLEDNNVGATLGEEQSEQHAGRATANDADARAMGRSFFLIVHRTLASR